MPLKPIEQVLQQLIGQSAWQHQRRLQTTITIWQTITPHQTQQNSRPQSIQDNILLIATKNKTWSQHLTLQRRRLLQQLNQHLTQKQTLPLTDLRFSSTHWYKRPAYSPLADPDLPHPSRVPQPPIPRQNPKNSPSTAVRAWFEQKQARLKQASPCPECGALTPQGELDRWQQCGCCIAQKWHHTKDIFPPLTSSGNASIQPVKGVDSPNTLTVPFPMEE